jgi:hypothetical protein
MNTPTYIPLLDLLLVLLYNINAIIITTIITTATMIAMMIVLELFLL